MLSQKFKATATRLGHAIKWLPIRLQRIGQHLYRFCWSSWRWWMEMSYLLLDFIALPELYETLMDWLKWNTRPLTVAEVNLLRPIFKESIQYERIRIDQRSFIGPPQWKICYVSFYTINSWGHMRPDLLIHEVMHIWQFHHVGSVYIPRALQAQYSPEGYNYGGGPKVTRLALQSMQLLDFNYEQQADLIADFWRLINGYPAVWGPTGPADLPFYRYFVDQLHTHQQAQV